MSGVRCSMAPHWIVRCVLPPKPKAPKRLRDLNQRAKRMLDIATSEVSDREPSPEEQGKSFLDLSENRALAKLHL